VKSVEVHFISGYPTANICSVRHSYGGAIKHCTLHVCSCWFELTSPDMADHGPQSSVIDPVGWSVTVYVMHLYQFVLAICNR